MSDQFYEELLAKLKKANKVRKLYVANKAGYFTVEEYQKFLESNINAETILETLEKELPKIHNVNILDTSGSMRGSKFKSAEQGLIADIKALKDFKLAKYTQTLAYFKHNKPFIYAFNSPNIAFELPTKYNLGNSTPLYATIEKVLTMLKASTKDEKVLVKIFTDGQENANLGYEVSSSKIAKLIEECKGLGYTITFVGTRLDVNRVINKLNITSSNTLVHDNTSEGVKKAFKMSNEATRTYTKKVVAGEDVLTGFYKSTTETL